MGAAGGVVGGVEVIFGLPCRVGLGSFFIYFRFLDATMIAWCDRRLQGSLSELWMRITSIPENNNPHFNNREHCQPMWRYPENATTTRRLSAIIITVRKLSSFCNPAPLPVCCCGWLPLRSLIPRLAGPGDRECGTSSDVLVLVFRSQDMARYLCRCSTSLNFIPGIIKTA